MTRRRSAFSLLVSGAATITLDQRLRAPKPLSTADGFRADREALSGDRRRLGF